MSLCQTPASFFSVLAFWGKEEKSWFSVSVRNKISESHICHRIHVAAENDLSRDTRYWTILWLIIFLKGCGDE